MAAATCWIVTGAFMLRDTVKVDLEATLSIPASMQGSHVTNPFVAFAALVAWGAAILMGACCMCLQRRRRSRTGRARPMYVGLGTVDAAVRRAHVSEMSLRSLQLHVDAAASSSRYVTVLHRHSHCTEASALPTTPPFANSMTGGQGDAHQVTARDRMRALGHDSDDDDENYAKSLHKIVSANDLTFPSKRYGRSKTSSIRGAEDVSGRRRGGMSMRGKPSQASMALPRHVEEGEGSGNDSDADDEAESGMDSEGRGRRGKRRSGKKRKHKKKKKKKKKHKKGKKNRKHPHGSPRASGGGMTTSDGGSQSEEEEEDSQDDAGNKQGLGEKDELDLQGPVVTESTSSVLTSTAGPSQRKLHTRVASSFTLYNATTRQDLLRKTHQKSSDEPNPGGTNKEPRSSHPPRSTLSMKRSKFARIPTLNVPAGAQSQGSMVSGASSFRSGGAHHGRSLQERDTTTMFDLEEGNFDDESSEDGETETEKLKLSAQRVI